MSARRMKYNPAFLSEEEVIESFVGREQDLELIVQVLRENVTEANQHVLVTGPRGIGKTMLVRRVAAEVRRQTELEARWYPLFFAEESYQVSSPGEFWLEALFHVAEQTGEERWTRTHAELRKEEDEARLRERALGQLMEFADGRGKRVVLIVENLNMLLGEQISTDGAWALRHTMLNEPRVMLLGTATSWFEELENMGKPMFELFKRHELRPLDTRECAALWASITGEEPNEGRIRPIEILTGGNPRLLMIMACFAEERSLRQLMEDLVHLVDDHTDYLKSHLDSLPAVERKVYAALAELWHPVTAREVAETVREEVSKASALLGRLAGRGMVSLTNGRGRTRRYQVAERLYNIYYLMRRRGESSRRVEAVVRFMVSLYGQEELIQVAWRIAEEACALEPELREDHYLTIEGLIKRTPDGSFRDKFLGALPSEFLKSPDMPPSLRSLLEYRAPSEKAAAAPGAVEVEGEKLNEEMRTLLERAGELAEDPERLDEAEALYRKVVEIGPESAGAWAELGSFLREHRERYEETEAAYRKALALNGDYARAWAGLGQLLHERLERYEEAERAYRKAIELDSDYAWPWACLGLLLHEKVGRYEEAEAAYRKATELAGDYAWPWGKLGQVLQEHLERYEEAEAAYRKAIELAADNAWPWACLGLLLHEKLERYEEAETAYRKAIEAEPKVAWGWVYLGQLLHEKLERYEEAEKAYRKAIELDEGYAWAWAWLGLLLHERLGRYEEAEIAYRKAVEAEPEVAWWWGLLGELLHEKLEGYEEAEKAYRKAIELDEGFAWAWAQLGQLLHEHLGRYEEAEAAYRKAIELAGDYAWPWVQLGRLLHEQLGRFEEAEAAYRKAIELKGDYAWAWAHLGRLLHEKLGRYEEAEKAYREAIKLDEGYAWPWAQLGQLLHEKLGRYEEAEVAYRKAMEAKPEVAWGWARLGLLLHEKLGQYDEAEEAYRKAVEREPDYALAWISLGGLLEWELGRYEEAEKAYRKALDVEPEVGAGWATLGALLDNHLERFEEAEAAYRKAIELAGDDASVWVALGALLYEKLGRHGEAEEAYRKAIELEAGCFGSIVPLLRETGRLGEALELARGCLARREGDADLLNDVAWDLHENSGGAFLEEVEGWAREAVELGPGEADYQHTLACILARRGKVAEALEWTRGYVEKSDLGEDGLEDMIELFVELAAAGGGREALEILQASGKAEAVEPLLVGLRLDLGEEVTAAAEILEVGKDVAQRIQARRESLQEEGGGSGGGG